jgi:hypothetical protein
MSITIENRKVVRHQEATTYDVREEWPTLAATLKRWSIYMLGGQVVGVFPLLRAECSSDYVSKFGDVGPEFRTTNAQYRTRREAEDRLLPEFRRLRDNAEALQEMGAVGLIVAPCPWKIGDEGSPRYLPRPNR